MLSYTCCKTYSVYEVYSASEEKLIKDIENLNCKLVAFRPPREGDWFLITGSNNVFRITDGCAFPEDCPRLIVEKLPTTVKGLTYPLTLKDIYGMDEVTIPQGYIVKGFRPPMKNEYYLNCNMFGHASSINFANEDPRIILEKEN